MATQISEKPSDEQIHDSNPFRPIYSCDCGKITGMENNEVFCWFCNKLCKKRPPRWRNYKGFVNERTNGSRELNSIEKDFYDEFFRSISLNHETVRNFAVSSFITRHLPEVVNCTITRCKYLNDRLLHPELYEVDMAETYSIIYDYVEYMFNGVYHQPVNYAEKAYDTLYKEDEEYLIQEITNILSYNLIVRFLN